MIPLCDLKQQYQALKPRIDAAMQDVAAAASYILGPNVTELEREIAAYCNTERAVGVASGTDALGLSLRALNVGPGDEVITTPFTFVATSEAIGILGATPVFADIDPDTLNIDPQWIDMAITPRTKAILPVHIYGQPCDMDPIMRLAEKYKLHVVEDCAQSIGARYRDRATGSFGDAGCFSFFPSKNLGCFGDGGMIVSNNEKLSERVEVLRRHGGRVKYHHDELGLNSRLDELQAAILRVKLPHLPEWESLRRRHAYHYNSIFIEMPEVICPRELSPEGPFVPTDQKKADGGRMVQCVYHQYTIRVPYRDQLCRLLKDAGIGNAVYYPVPLHLQKVHSCRGYRPGCFPCAEEASEHCISLPIFPELTETQVETVATTVRESIAAINRQSRSQGVDLSERPAA
ncbi:MAG: DegT/DnrJ/EryC1/StrS family aminotransferase [Pirellulales bacterium]|nr:DegT/DnrJ/EryC1/StrS family aminotransferase [Pirellulales bacterium]